MYVGIGAYIEKDGKFLILKRSPNKDFDPNIWEGVTGRLENNEEPTQGILREIQEEVQLDVDIIMPIDTGFFYRGGKEYPMAFIVFWCRYKSGKVQLNWEHTEYKWITLEEAIISKELQYDNERYKIIKKLKKYLPLNFKLKE
ncbi:MAG: NUDIX domain-containing protein [Candidatus Heimdallarchaeota archaeon]